MYRSTRYAADLCTSRASTSRADDDLGEADDLGVAEHLLDALLVVLGVALLEQHALLVPAVQLAVDDLRQRLLRLAGVAGLRLEDLALGRHLLGRRLVAGQVLGLAEGDVYGDVVGQLLRSTFQLDDDTVDAAVALDVEVGIDDMAGRRLEADDAAELDVLLEGDLEVVDGVGPVLGRVLTFGRDQRRQLIGQVHEVGR